MAANPLLDQGIKHFRQANYDQAVAYLERVDEGDPTAYAESLALLGRIYTKRRQFPRAKELLKRSLKIRIMPRTIFYQGECFFFEGDHEAAFLSLRQAISLDESLTDAFILLGRLQRDRKQFDEAIAFLEQALRNDPKALVARYQLALTAFMAGDLVRASAQAFLVRQAKDDFAPVHKLLGEISLKLGDHRQTAVEFCRLVELTELDAELFFKLGKSFAHIGDLEQALTAFEHAAARDKKMATALVAAARLSERLGRKERAIAFYQCLLKNPDYGKGAQEALKRLSPKQKSSKPPLHPPQPFKPAIFVPPEKLESTATKFDPNEYLNKNSSGLQLSSRTIPLERNPPTTPLSPPLTGPTEIPLKQLLVEEICKESLKKRQQLEDLARKYFPGKLVKRAESKRQELMKTGRGVLMRILKREEKLKENKNFKYINQE